MYTKTQIPIPLILAPRQPRPNIRGSPAVAYHQSCPRHPGAFEHRGYPKANCVRLRQLSLGVMTTLQETKISHLGKGKIIFKSALRGNMLVLWRVVNLTFFLWVNTCWETCLKFLKAYIGIALLFIYVSISIFISISISLSLSLYLYLYLSTYLPTYLSTYLSTYLPIYTYLYLSIPIYTYLFLSIAIYSYL